MACQGSDPVRWVPTLPGVVLVLGALAVGSPARAGAAVEVRCPGLSAEQAAAFEARAHAELLVRGLSGNVRLSCDPDATLEWQAADGHPARSRAPARLEIDALLAALVALLAEGPAETEAARPTPAERPASQKDEPTASEPIELRAGPGAHLWGDRAALGGGASVAIPLGLLRMTAGGNVNGGYLSYERVALWLLEARVGVELTSLEPLLLSLGGGAGRPFTTEPSTVTRTGASENPWFAEGFARLAWPIRWSSRVQLHVGAQVVLLSRPVRLRVDEVLAYDFGWQPGAFAELAFELH